MAKDLVQGLRIDHIDGLTEPRAYLERLQRRIAEKLGFRLVDHRMELYGVAATSER